MAGLAIDDAAWSGPWRSRPVADKAVLALGLLTAALLLPPWPGSALAGSVAVVCALVWARVPARLLARTLVAPVTFVALSALSVAVSVGRRVDGAVWAWGPFSLAPESVERAAGLVVHGLAGCACLLLLATTTPMADLLAAARRARVPDACVEVASLMYRLVFVLLESVRQIREAQTSRLGYTSLARSYRSTGALVARVLVRAWDRARRLEDGLAGRGYESAMPTLTDTRAHSARFVVASLALVGGVVAVGVLA